jgi:hypothetical protein
MCLKWKEGRKRKKKKKEDSGRKIRLRMLVETKHSFWPDVA